MKRNQWIRLAIFLIGFAFFLALPLHQYWVRKYTKGNSITLPVVVLPFPADSGDPCRITFVHEGIIAAGKNATELGSGYVCFETSGETARCSAVVAERKAIPGNTPFLIQRDLKLTPDGKRYIVPILLHYFAENPADAANLRIQIAKAKSIKLEITVFPNGDYSVQKVRLD